MKCGHLSTKDGTNAGFGRSCAGAHAKSSLLSSGIMARQLVASLGSKSRKLTKAAGVTSDFWGAYQLVFPAEPHACVGKGSGQTNHMERWYNRLRQSNARFVRKTLSFSKSDAMHEVVTKLFIIRYNPSLVT
jgi:IS1 family transposase